MEVSVGFEEADDVVGGGILTDRLGQLPVVSRPALAKIASDLDAGSLRIRQQIQRIHGQLRCGSVKPKAGNRLPIPDLARAALVMRLHQQSADEEAFSRAWTATGLVFITRTSLPVEPRNLVQSFRRICDHNDVRMDQSS